MTYRHTLSRAQQGVAAVEFALLLPILVVLLAAPLFFGRVFWHYTMAQKAAHDAALYLSKVPEIELRTPALLPAVLEVARQIAQAELEDINQANTPYAVGVLCNDIPCDGLSTPTQVSVVVRIEVHDWFGIYSGDGLLLTGDVHMAYLGAN